MLYCIDSHNFIWCVKKEAEEHDKHRLVEAERFMQYIDKNKHHLMIPTIVLAECLIKSPEDTHSQIIADAYHRFMVVDFDSRCALKYGELLRLEKWEAAKQVMRENDIRREKMKLDHMIISCALVHGANAIYSSDIDVIKFGDGIIKVLDMPKIAIQTEMSFDNNDRLIIDNGNSDDVPF